MISVLFCLARCCAVDLKCEFRYEVWAVIDRVYECKCHPLEVKTPNQTIGKVLGTYASGKNHKSVVALHIFGQTCHYIPDRIQSVFSDLEGLLIAYSGLKRILVSDLKPFAKLQVLFLPNNDLEVLGNDLFMFNPQLKAIVLNHNKIKHVSHDILLPLKHLSKMYLYKNDCVDSVAVNPLQMQDLVIELIDHCPPVTNSANAQKSEIQVRFGDIDAKMKELERKVLSKFDVLIQKMERVEKLILSQNKKN